MEIFKFTQKWNPQVLILQLQQQIVSLPILILHPQIILEQTPYIDISYVNVSDLYASLEANDPLFKREAIRLSHT